MECIRGEPSELSSGWSGMGWASKKGEDALGLTILVSNPFQSQSILFKLETLHSEPLPFFPAEIMFISRNI